MKRELTPNEIIFSASCNDTKNKDSAKRISEFKTALNKLKKALNIDKDGYNIYYIDSFSKERLENLKCHIEKLYEDCDPPKDICYVIAQDELNPKPMFLPNGKGRILKDMVDDIKGKYLQCVINFYQDSSEDEKESILEEINEKRNEYITKLMDMAKAKKFDVKATSGGFVFIPLKDEGEEMSQEEYDELECDTQNDIEKEAVKLKKEAEVILENLKYLEVAAIDKLKELYRDYLKDSMQEEKDDFLLEFISDDDAYRYIVEMFSDIEDEIVDCYTINLEDDEDEIKKVLKKYSVNVLVDNSTVDHPRVIYEEDPTLGNLIGTIDYRNNSSGVYITDISLINAGSLLKANGGCLIIRLSSLINSGLSYYYLKKALIHGKADYNYTRNYLEVLSIAGLKPDPIPINVKIVLIGDYESFDILYNHDEDFRRVFPLRIEADMEFNYNSKIKDLIIDNINHKIKNDKLLPIKTQAIDEVIKYLARITGNRSKVVVDDYYINKLLYLSNNTAKLENRSEITEADIRSVAYEEEKIHSLVMDSYRNKQILITTTGSKIGIVNALAVISSGEFSFGKPMRVTCLALPGDGQIIDVHRESKMSGNIHEKSIGILRGLISYLLSPYEKLPVDLQLSFEQTYGMIEGDSASVAEIICILSALSKRPIRQNIAVTGSINQFGEVQPIGGVNEKIEGFYDVCKTIDNVSNKGVLIPSTNKNDLVLKYEVEEDIRKKKFHIYTMDSLEDAIETLIVNDGESVKGFFKGIEEELLKYKKSKSKK